MHGPPTVAGASIAYPADIRLSRHQCRSNKVSLLTLCNALLVDPDPWTRNKGKMRTVRPTTLLQECSKQSSVPIEALT